MSDDPIDDRKDAADPSPSGEDLVRAARRRRKPRARKAEAAAEAAAEAEPEEQQLAPSDEPERADPGRRAAEDRKRTSATGDLPAMPADEDDRFWGRTARQLGVWGVAAAAAGILLMILSLGAALVRPEAPPIAGRRVLWLPGPQIPEAEVWRWVRAFPQADQLTKANRWVLDELKNHLANQPAVAEVRRIALVQRVETLRGRTRLVRDLELTLALRTPYLPAVAATGERLWIDEDGRLLPGILPRPSVRRPLVRGIESGGARVTAAVQVWRRMEPAVAPGLVAEIRCDEPLDQLGNRGLVLLTRTGSRLEWGRPEEARYGIDNDRRTAMMLHSLACQGDLSRVAAINVRFHEPFYTLREP